MTSKEIDQLQVGDYIQYAGEMYRARPKYFPIWQVMRFEHRGIGYSRVCTAVFVRRVTAGKYRQGWDCKTIQKLRLINYRKLNEGEVASHVII